MVCSSDTERCNSLNHYHAEEILKRVYELGEDRKRKFKFSNFEFP